MPTRNVHAYIAISLAFLALLRRLAGLFGDQDAYIPDLGMAVAALAAKVWPGQEQGLE